MIFLRYFKILIQINKGITNIYISVYQYRITSVIRDNSGNLRKLGSFILWTLRG